MGFVSYAQNLEDVILWRALQHIPNGFYVDIGAQDPIEDSVSLGFYEQGWRGMHVEPSSHWSQKLREHRPEETIIQVAIGDRPGLISFYEIPETGLSTGLYALASEYSEQGFRVNEVVVPCVTLDDLFQTQMTREVHWLKIDVEGMEREVLQGWRESSVRPWIVVVESTKPLTQTPTHTEWESLLIDKGYTFAYFDGLNRFYISNQHLDLRRHFLYGPSIWDDFVFDVNSTYKALTNIKSTVRSLEGRVADLRELVEKTTNENAYLSSQLDELRNVQSEAVKLEVKVHEMDLSFEQERRQNELLTTQVRELEALNHQLRSEIDAIYSTRSWRWTLPLRKINVFISGRVQMRRISFKNLKIFLRRFGQSGAVVIKKYFARHERFKGFVKRIINIWPIRRLVYDIWFRLADDSNRIEIADNNMSETARLIYLRLAKWTNSQK